jgi:hypothetical protein
MMATTLLLILDDLSTDFTYSGPHNLNWTRNGQPRWYGGTSMVPFFANATIFGSFELSFQGMSRFGITFKQFW